MTEHQGAAGAAAEPAVTNSEADLVHYLSELSEHLYQQSSQQHTSDILLPPELEELLNGGANPMISWYFGEVVTYPSLPANARILDLGCGYGRIALELTTRLGANQHYFGLDPHAPAVDWAAQHIGAAHPNFSFDHIDVASRVYNDAGTLQSPDFRFPFDDGSLDVVLMVSVNTHIDIGTVESYIREAARTLNPETGRLIATYFLLDEQVDQWLAEGKSTFSMPFPHGPSRVENSDNPELAIAHPRALVLDLLREAGFESVTIIDGSWSGRTGTGPLDYQDLVVAHRGEPVQLSPTITRTPDQHNAAEHADRARALLARGFGSAQQVRHELAWAFPTVVNALWWHLAGYTLAAQFPASTEVIDLDYSRLLALGFDRHRPETTAAEPQFVAVSDHDMLTMLTAADSAATRDTIADAMVELSLNSTVIRAAHERGATLVLVAADGSVRPAPVTIPPAEFA